MTKCPQCGAPVSKEAAFCGECGTDLTQEPRSDTEEPVDTAEKITERVREEREAEDDEYFSPRAKGVLYTIGGLVMLGFGYWIGFVGYTSVEMGPQGYGVYQITYPIAGIIILIFGGLALLTGIGGLGGADI